MAGWGPPPGSPPPGGGFGGPPPGGGFGGPPPGGGFGGPPPGGGFGGPPPGGGFGGPPGGAPPGGGFGGPPPGGGGYPPAGGGGYPPAGGGAYSPAGYPPQGAPPAPGGAMVFASDEIPQRRNPIVMYVVPNGGQILGVILIIVGIVLVGAANSPALFSVSALGGLMALAATILEMYWNWGMSVDLKKVSQSTTFSPWFAVIPIFSRYFRFEAVPDTMEMAKRRVGALYPRQNRFVYFFFCAWAMATDLNQVADAMTGGAAGQLGPGGGVQPQIPGGMGPGGAIY